MDGAVARAGTDWRIARMPAGLAGSVGLHAILLLALFTLTPLRSFVVPEAPAITVELVPVQTADSPPAAAPRPVAEAPAEEPNEPPPPVAAEAQPPTTATVPAIDSAGSFRATKLYAAALLKTPAMAAVRRGLSTLAASETVMQLCSIEALEQIRLAAPSLSPDTMVSYAMADPIQTGLMLTAMGAAFRSRRLWYGVSFECVAAPALDGVESFSFKLGEAIPRDQWEAHFLNAADEDE